MKNPFSFLSLPSLKAFNDRINERADRDSVAMTAAQIQIVHLRAALEYIASQRTPSMNATARRCVEKAERALG